MRAHLGALAGLAVLVGACALPAAHVPVGTRVPMVELYDQRADLDRFVQHELAAGHAARAFYALELAKTRPYSEAALAARTHAAPALAATDLREVFAIARADRGGDAPATVADRRGLVLARTRGATTRYRDVASAAFWTHMRRFEQRTAPLNDTTIGIAYDDAARIGYGVSTAEETARLFASDEALVSWFVHADTVTAFVIARGQLHVERLAISARELATRIQRLVARVRDPRAAAAGDRTWRIAARELHAAVLAPLERVLGEPAALYVSPHGSLANLPFGLLVDARDRLVVETHRVTYVPSASIYRQLLSRPILNRPPRLLAVGNAVYPEGVASLEYAEREAVTVAELFPDGRLLAGEAASEAEVTALLPAYNILHFATHGVLLGGYLPGASSLLVSADAAHDGFLSANEIAALDLSRSYIAVLSACETSVDDGGDLGTIANAFFTAGAPSVLGTLWQVDDAATTAVMLAFYRHFLERGPGEALRRAQLAVRADPRFAHPYFWAAFVLFGWDK